jgi:hypothetical protein
VQARCNLAAQALEILVTLRALDALLSALLAHLEVKLKHQKETGAKL